MEGKIILITGGTGSLGHALVDKLLPDVEKLIIYSRDEFKQGKMASKYENDKLRFFIGNVRDLQRLRRAFEGVDYVIHAAALKQVPALEYNPAEAVKTNVIGAMNVIEAALDREVKKAIGISTDKAVNPINLYGATKLCAEKLFFAANAYGGNRTKFSCVRYGNVIGSRGSIIPLFKKLAAEGKKVFPITDVRATRFWISLDKAAEFVIKALNDERTGIFVPKIPSARIVDIAWNIEPDCSFEQIGLRQGEKLHEILIAEWERNIISEQKAPYTSDQNPMIKEDVWMNGN